MTITHDTMTVETVLQAVRQLAPSILDRAGEIEAGRRMPPDLLDQLRAAGCFRLVRPATHGGLEASIPDAMRALESLARADASVAWTVMIGAGSWIDLAHLPRETFDALYATNPDAITAGVFNPTASVVPVDGGYRVDGRWSFASGCEHADVLFGNGVEGIVDGMPQLRGAVFAPGDVTIEDTWSVSGLCGTGSHHFHVDGTVVPAERTYDPMGGEPCIDALIVHLPPPAVFSLVMASVALGHRPGRARRHHGAGVGQGAVALTGRARWQPRCSSSTWPPPTPTCAQREACSTTKRPRCGRPRRRATR